MRILKSKKALSPVVAAIILIAVTVAVSIAVAAWMGSMTFNFMETEQMSITSVTFTDNTSPTLDTITVYVQNTGTTDIEISETAAATGNGITGASTVAGPVTAGGTASFVVTLTGELEAGSLYNVELLSTKGNKFSYTDTA
ncbi:archaellin/type IV pilin N-terminal domain-containing protein [Thermoproteota archaeon]